uniref:Peptidase S1 domain-containing protein n=1 Tax=Anopheles dirus TaxID=7168 RepID=A0A182NEI1_9DIPT
MEYACGGSIIDENTVVTAAHCVINYNGPIPKRRMSVHVGQTNLKQENEYTRIHYVKDLIAYPGFTKDSIANDVALIKLTTNITMSKYVQPVCLWTMDNDLHSIVGQNGTVVGFGLMEKDVLSDHLKQALMNIVDPLVCIATDPETYGTHLTTEMFCGKGQNGVSACNGDSGGGIFLEVGGKWFIRGLVSFIPEREKTNLCDNTQHTVYTDVAKYVGWITQHIDERVLHNESVIDVDYEEKLRLFNFDTCGLRTFGKIQRHFLRGFELFKQSCDPTKPSVYVDVNEYLDWILYNMRYNEPETVEDGHSTSNLESDWSTFLQEQNEELLRLRQLDAASCQQRFVQYGFSYRHENGSICTVHSDDERQAPVSVLAGSPLQSLIQLNGRKRYFLRGFKYSTNTGTNVYLPLIFTDIHAHIEWIVERIGYNKRKNLLYRVGNSSDTTDDVSDDPIVEDGEMVNNELKSCLLLLAVLFMISEAACKRELLSCGRRKLKTVYLIHHGTDAIAGHWPWHVAIFHQKVNKSMEYACGGSIIDENTIVTAAHCVTSNNGLMSRRLIAVHVGRTRLNQDDENTQIYDVQELIEYPGFTKGSIENDVALIKLTTNITMSKYVQPVCLWTMDNDLHSIVGQNGTVVGFGLMENDVVSDHLKQAMVNVVDPMECIASNRPMYGTHLTTEMFCGKGQNGVSACNGDSGGGLFLKVGGKWYVRGLVSFVPEREKTSLCDNKQHTVYMDVAKYVGWITQYIDERVLHNESVIDVDYDEKLRLFNFDTLDVQLGISLLIMAQIVKIERVIIHPKYNNTNFENDIALIELSSPANLSHPMIAAVCLPVIPELRPNSTLGMTTFITNSAFSEFYLITPAGFVNTTVCMGKYASRGLTMSLQNNQFCAHQDEGVHGKCKALKAGAPLHQYRVTGESVHFFLRGMDLFTQSCDPAMPSAFIDIHEYMDWILYNMRYINTEVDKKRESSLESDWTSFQGKHDNDTVSLFNMYKCGVAASYESTLDSYS